MSIPNNKLGDETDQGLSPSEIETLDHLFHAAPPSELRENLIELYHSYLVRCHDTLPVNFGQIARNVYHLINCLGEIGKKS